jgi:RHS repeat-associated protein
MLTYYGFAIPGRPIKHHHTMFKKAFTCILLFMLGWTSVHAAVEPYEQQIRGKLKKGDTLIVKDEKFRNSAYDWSTIQNKSVTNSITFGLFRDTVMALNKPFSCDLDLKVEYWSQPDQATPITLEHVALKIDYDTTYGAVYQGQAIYNFNNAYRVKITINDISSKELGSDLPPIFTLTGHVVVDRQYTAALNPIVPTVFFVKADQAAEGGALARGVEQTDYEVSINWTKQPPEAEYDLEWTFIDEESEWGEILELYGRSTSFYLLGGMFRNNSTRITTALHNYNISLVHSSKYLLIRMRAVTYTGNKRIEQPWSYLINLDGVNVSGVITLDNNWHESRKNWQYSATYAEDGKRKEVVSYYDGTLRSRQAVTVSQMGDVGGTDRYAVVQENIYDEFGRKVASILPAPTKAKELKYYPGFNLALDNGAPYSYKNVYKGSSSASCLTMPDKLSNTAGAAKYYSNQNAFLADASFNKYIPDAEGYPLAVTAYTSDNTGRVSLQGGVGPVFQPNAGASIGNKATRYFYGKPEQWELDRLFGNDVGYAYHYLKNMVIDPNGQISISYVNASGKTIATALGGETPNNTAPLTTQPLVSTETIPLLEPESFVFDSIALKMIGTTTFLVAVPDPDANFNYTIDQLIKKYSQNNVTICSNCYYELKIKVYDDCNVKVYENDDLIKIGSATSNCNLIGVNTGNIDVPMEKIGTYYISFELSLNPDVISSYTDDFIARNTNLKTLFQFILAQLQRADFFACYSECLTCQESLGAKTAFVAKLVGKLESSGVNVTVNAAAINTWAGGLYDALYNKCQTLRATCLPSPCANLRKLLEGDVSPGGQYALFNAAGQPLETQVNVLYQNWRTEFKILPKDSARYQASLFQLEDGSYTSPHDAAFTLQMLVRYWKDEWAAKLVKYHPESCALTDCENNTTYLQWDEKVKTMYPTAASIPGIKPGLQYQAANASWLLAADPFFTPGTGDYNRFKADLDNYSRQVLKATDTRLVNKGLTQYVDYQLYCADKSGNTNTTVIVDTVDTWNKCIPVSACRVPDREWVMYREMYFELKEKYYREKRRSIGCGVGGCQIGVTTPVIPGQPVPPVIDSTKPCDLFDIKDFRVTQTQSGPDTRPYVCYMNTAAKPIPPGMTLKVNFNVQMADPDLNNGGTGWNRTAVIIPESAYCNGYGAALRGPSPGAVMNATLLSVQCTYDACANITTSDFSVVYAGDNFKPTIFDINYNGGTAKPIPEGMIITVKVNMRKLDGTIYSVDERFTSSTLTNWVNAFRNDSNNGAPVWIESISCTTPPPVCPSEYVNKVSRINDIDYNQVLPSDTAKLRRDGMDTLNANLDVNCRSMADDLIRQLDPCLKSKNASTTTINALKQEFYEILRLGADQDHMYGASTTKVPRPGGKPNSIEAAIKTVLNLSKLDTLCNPWVLNMPYPANVKGQSVERMLSSTNSDICTKLNALKQEHTSVGGSTTFYDFLKSKFGTAMNISLEDLNALQKGCGNCRYLLDKDVKMPVFLDPITSGCINVATFNAAQQDFKTAMDNPKEETSNYETFYVNYMNQRLGFSLGYASYKDFKDKIAQNPNTSALLCNEPAFITIEKDPYECLLTVAGIAINAGKREYDAYIDSVKRDFRRLYVLECSATKARVRATVKQQLYHFTLYYYDNAGNLLRTVPPEGVKLLNNNQLEQVRIVRKLKDIVCTYDGPDSNTPVGPAFQHLNNALGASNQAVEMWVYNDGSGPVQVINTTGKYLFNVCIDGRYLHGDVYSINEETGAVNLTGSNHVVVDMGSQIPLRPWTHVVLQGSMLSGSTISAYVNGILCPAADNPPRGSCTWQVAIVDGQPVITQNLAFLKHLRMYTRLLTSAEILANAQEPCLAINKMYATSLNASLRYWARFNTPAPGSATTVPGGGTTEQQYAAIYPNHKMTSDYAYNTLNQVLKQYTPDAKESRFWYDNFGRMYASQNSEQRKVEGTYSYTRHDAQNRVREVGEKINAASPDYEDYTPQMFLNSGVGTQQTVTFYDNPQSTIYPQENVRQRVAESRTVESGVAVNSTFYSYDLTGNVSTLTQVLKGLDVKQINYKYDLVSGKVNTVRYQPQGNDKFYYGYKYDAENRLIEAQSGIASSSADQWTINLPVTDALYRYYKHGPLARMVLGDKTVQGVDYAYTLQGWLKGINGNYLQPANEMGQDGVAGLPTSTVAQDVMALSLDYFTGDYKPIEPQLAKAFSLQWDGTNATVAGRDLFNGNISRSTLGLSALTDKHVGYSYGYDQLNRLVRMRQHPLVAGAPTWGAMPETGPLPYKEDITYDGNGNILTYLRNGAGTSAIPLDMDKLTYNYKAGTNQLKQVRDAVTFNQNDNLSVDLKNQPNAENYRYDEIGNLIADDQGKVKKIEWTVYGKIKSVENTDGGIVKYLYDGAGNRVYKEDIRNGVTNKTWYVRDAQGNTLAVYGNKNGDNNIYWQEQHLYGSSRLGMWLPNMSMASNNAATEWTKVNGKRYELSNHLGNVLATISEGKNTVGSIFTATVTNMGDYAPFGMPMVGRQHSALGAGKYRYGFNGKENDNEVKGDGNQQDYGMRIYDPRVGRFLSVDPITSKYPELTPYQFASNRAIDGIDQDGLEYIKALPNFPNSGDRTVVDYVNAANNAAIDVINTIPSIWNGGVDLYKSLRKETFISDFKRGSSEIGGALKATTGAILNDPIRTLTSPDALRAGLGFYIGAKAVLPKGGNNGNLLKFSSSKANTALEQAWVDQLRELNNISKRRNIAYLEGSVEGVPMFDVGISGSAMRKGTVGNPTNRFFTTIEVGGFSRALDSEVKLLENFAGKYIKTPNIKGRLTLTSELPYCESCTGVIKQFEKIFTNVKLERVNGVNTK